MHSTSAEGFNVRELRNALGSFATGVTIVTTRSRDGKLHGMTANSFTSVSLNPPLVLWSSSLYAQSLPAFQEGAHFVVNILAYDQIDLSNKFAKQSDDKFVDVDHIIPESGAPMHDRRGGAFRVPQRVPPLRRRPHHLHRPCRALRLHRQADPDVLPRQIHPRRTDHDRAESCNNTKEDMTMLTQSQRAAYDRDGVIVVPDVFSAAEIAELRAVTDGFVARSARGRRQ